MRVKILRISKDIFLRLFQKPSEGTFFRAVDRFVPDDAEIINVQFNMDYASVDLMIRSEAYPDVQPGSPVLVANDPWFGELMILPNQPEYESLNIPAITGSVAT